MRRSVGHYGDKSVSRYVSVGDFTFLVHHSGGSIGTLSEQLDNCFREKSDSLLEIQAEKSDIVQINLYLKNIKDIRTAESKFLHFFGEFPPTCTTSTSSYNNRNKLF